MRQMLSSHLMLIFQLDRRILRQANPEDHTKRSARAVIGKGTRMLPPTFKYDCAKPVAVYSPQPPGAVSSKPSKESEMFRQIKTAWSTACKLVLPLALIAAQEVVAYAETPPSVEDYVGNAATVLLVRRPGTVETEALPPTVRDGLIVDRALKGFDTRRYVPVPNNVLRPGQEALLLLPMKTVGTAVAGSQPVYTLWPLSEPERQPRTVDTGHIALRVNAGLESLYRAIGKPMPPVMLSDVAGIIENSAPEEVGLQSDLLSMLLFTNEPSRRIRDEARANYVALVLAVRDLARDMPALAQLLESAEPDVRSAAERYLRSITPPDAPQIRGSDPVSRRAAVIAWQNWWSENSRNLLWSGERYRLRTVQDGFRRECPRVPENMILPGPELPDSLAQRLNDSGRLFDRTAFERAFRAFLDSGCERDRALVAALAYRGPVPAEPKAPLPKWADDLLKEPSATDRRPYLLPILWPDLTATGVLVSASSLTSVIGGSGFLISAPRLRPEILFNPEIPAIERTRIIVAFAIYAHTDWFDQERRLAWTELKTVTDMDTIRRSAFWEVDDNFAYHAAVPALVVDEARRRLGQSADPSDMEFLVTLYLQRPTKFLDPIRKAIQLNRDIVIQALLGQIPTSTGPLFHWTTRLLAQEKQTSAMRLIAGRLKDDNVEDRASAAAAFVWNPDPQWVPDVLAALGTEDNKDIRESLIIAVAARSSDARALDTLLAVSNGPLSENALGQVIHALGNSGSEKALPTLARFAMEAKNESIRLTAINSFGYISELFGAVAPRQFVTPQIQIPINEAMAIIERWRQEHADGK
jgi:HEAT repeat protein